MFHWLENFHLRVSRRLLSVGIGARLFALMALAASVTFALAVAGVAGLGASKESLRSVYEDRMLPLQQLAQISNLMLSNRLLLQTALSEVTAVTDADHRVTVVMNRAVATMAANAIEKNIEAIGLLWRVYIASSLNPVEVRLADQFAKTRGAFVDEALLPAVVALRANHYEKTKMLADRARVLYDGAGPALQVLNRLQFDTARDAYTRAVKRHEATRMVAIATLCVAVLVMSWLGLMLATSIVSPLTQVIAIFKRISNGQYDSNITIDGRDEMR